MKWYPIIPAGTFVDAFVFLEEDDQRRLQVRRRYADLACPNPRCRKFDEYAALDRGLEPGLTFRLRRDFGSSADDCLLAGPRFRDFVIGRGLAGLAFIADAAGSASAIRPTAIMRATTPTAGLDLRGAPCPTCGRHRLSVGRPSISDMDLSEAQDFFSTDVRPESRYARFATVYARGSLVADMRAAGLTGIDWGACERFAEAKVVRAD